jgi:hypothetical protein
MRLLKLYEAKCANDHATLGAFMERELGIKVLHKGPYNIYIAWSEMLKWELRDVLCSVTLVGKYLQNRGRSQGFVSEVNRILSEEHSAYTVDNEFGVHPAIDTAYRLSVVATVRALGGDNYAAARNYVERADEQLLPNGDLREAVRAAFAATENVFKMTFKGTTQLHTPTMQAHLRPWVDRLHSEPTAKRAALRICDSMQDWVEACHNYRHAENKPEPEPPPEHVAVSLVSQGIAYLRWLVDLRSLHGDAGNT